MDDRPDIVVVGSANLDLIVAVERHPRAGETVMGGNLESVPGGKGANQATAAARLGRATAFVGRIGDDEAGRILQRSLDESGVDTSALAVSADVPTGVALISVADDAENTIVVSPGANAQLRPHDLGDAVVDAAVLLVQLEVPMDCVQAAAQMATGRVILNPAPVAPLSSELLAATDILVPNQTELAGLTGTEPARSLDAVIDAARALPVAAVVVTLGAQGAVVIDNGVATRVAAPTIEPIDTTAAGDAFCAALADGLLGDDGDLLNATQWAVQVGAATTLRAGAAPSLPTRSQVEALLRAEPLRGAAP